MIDIIKLCDELETLLKVATPGLWKARNALVYLGGHGGFSLHNCPDSEENAELIASLHAAAQPLIDAARENEVRKNYIASCERRLNAAQEIINGLRDRIKELEQELKERTK